MCLNRLLGGYNLSPERAHKIYQNAQTGLHNLWNKFLARKGLLRLCENVAAERAYKIYQNAWRGLDYL